MDQPLREELLKYAYQRKRRKKSETLQRAKALAPLAGVGFGIGVGKGFIEKDIESRLKKAISKKKKFSKKMPYLAKKLPWGISRGGAGALSTFVIGLTMADALSKMKSKARNR